MNELLGVALSLLIVMMFMFLVFGFIYGVLWLAGMRHAMEESKKAQERFDELREESVKFEKDVEQRMRSMRRRD
jgi:predicted membrane protein